LADTFLLKTVDLTTTNATQIYKVPITDDASVPPTASTTALVKSILVSEDSNNADTITITITDTASAVIPIFKDKAISAKATVELLTQPLVLQDSEILKAQVATGNRLHIVASYLEIS